MAHLQYMPGDPRLVDQLVYELKSKGIFDQFRKDCIADVDTKPAYQNLRQRVENSVSTFLSRQCWQPDINKNQLREKLRKHILDGNYLEQGVERIVDQVVNPKVASVFIPQVEDLVYNYLGISRKKSTVAETSNGPKTEDLLPTDLEAVSPGSVNNDEKEAPMEVDGVQQETNMQIDDEKSKSDTKDDSIQTINEKEKFDDCQPDTISVITPKESDTSVIDKENIPFPPEEIVVENIPPPENSPPKVELEKIELPNETSVNIPLPEEMSEDIPLPDEISDKNNKEQFFKPINTDDDDDSSSDSSLRRNMSPLTPIRNYNNENSYDAQQAFENDSLDTKNEDDKKEPSSFRFTIETKSPEKSNDIGKVEKKDTEASLSYQFNNQVNINHFNTPLYEDSSNSHNLQIDYESDANSKINIEAKTMEIEHTSEDSRKDKKPEEKRNSHKSSHRSRDSHKHSSSSRDKRADSKQSCSRDSSRHDKSKSSKDEKSKTNDKEKPKEKNDKKDSKDSSRHRSSHKSSHKDSKSHRSSSSSHRHSTKHDDKKTSSSSSQKEKSSDKEKKESSKEKSRDRSSSHRSDKDRKSSSSNSSKNKHEEKDKDKKSKKETDDHYSLSGRGNPNRRSTDRDSNDGSSSSKGSNNPPSSKSSQTKTDSKRSSKLDTTSTSGDSTSPSDKENISYEIGTQARDLLKHKPIVRIEKNLETPVSSPPRLPFVPEIVIRKPKIAANFEEAKKIMKMRKFLEEEQRRMNQEAALLLEFQANVRPSLSQVYSNVSGPELEFACIKNENQDGSQENLQNDMIQPTVVQEMPKYMQRSEEIETDTPKVSENRQDLNTPVNVVKEFQEDSKSQQNETNEKRRTEYFEVTIITEELSESEDIQNDENIKQDAKPDCTDEIKHIDSDTGGLEELKYFGEHEKYDAELERAKYSEFFKNISQNELNNKMYLINCDTYAENVFREATKEFGDFNIVNYHRNGHLKINKPTTVKNLSTEVSIPVDNYEDSESSKSPIDVFSPQKSDCSFELSSDYNAKLEEMVNKTSRQEIMEIILGGVSDSANMPKIDYFTESNIDLIDERKRKYDEEYSMNNNEHVLIPNKLRKLSSDHITSTTKESEEPDNNVLNNTRSKYLGRPGRVGLPKPRRSLLPNSPSSDKSVENYEQNTQTGQTVNGKIKPRNKVQRYDTSDLYKPKLHYLKRNNIT